MVTRMGTFFGRCLIGILVLVVISMIAGIIRGIVLEEPTLIFQAIRWFFFSSIALYIVATLFLNRNRLIAIEAALKDR